MQTHITTTPNAIGLGVVELLVKDLQRVADFYQAGVGLEVIRHSSEVLELGSQGQKLVRLVAGDTLNQAESGSAGLYHMALLFSNRAQLVEVLNRLFKSHGAFFQGSADHLVSEAFYFQDPEGNGVELYFDRPQQDWNWQDGQVQMNSLYLDPIAYSAAHGLTEAIREQIVMGHVHLRVGDLSQAEYFYGEILGLVKTAAFSGALFMSDGWYHHHLGLNTWESQGASRRSPSLGLGSFTIVLQRKTDVQALKERLQQAQWEYVQTKTEIKLSDPWDNQFIVSLAE